MLCNHDSFQAARLDKKIKELTIGLGNVGMGNEIPGNENTECTKLKCQKYSKEIYCLMAFTRN